MKAWEILIAVIVILLIPVGIWVYMNIPCSFYSFTSASDVPARCIGGFVR